MKFRKQPVVIEAITFAELVQHGRDNGANIVGGMPWSFKYNGHPITHENDQCYIVPTNSGSARFTPDDMLITQIDGEIYPCRLSLFAETYEPVLHDSDCSTNNRGVPELLGDCDCAGLKFGEALESLKLGSKLARAGWNGKGMFVYFVPANNYPAQTGAAKAYFGEGAMVPYNAYFAIKGVDERVSTWVPSISDVLAEDWQIVL